MSQSKKQAITATTTQKKRSIPYKTWLQERFQQDPQEIVDHLNAMLGAPNEPELFLQALGDVAKAKGMAQLSDSTGLNREGLYDTLSEKGNPRFDNLLKILDAMGLRFVVEKKP